MRNAISSIKKGGEWFLGNIGPIGLWLLIFLGLVIVFALFSVKDVVDTTREHEETIVGAYNKRLEELKIILGVVEEEEKTRLSGDSDFTKAYVKYKFDTKQWQEQTENTLQVLLLKVQHVLDDQFTGSEYDQMQKDAKAKGMTLPDRPKRATP